MSFIQQSIKGISSSWQDPWDWSVDEVVLALTDHDSQLLKANAPSSLPDARILANVLRENDVTGLALLTEVNTLCLRDELGIKSLGHRATIKHLIRQLQNMSAKFQEQAQRCASLSSVGLGSGIGSPYFATPSSFEARAASRVLGLQLSPVSSSVQRQDQHGLGQPPAQLRNILEEGPELQRIDPSNAVKSRSLKDTQNGEGLIFDVDEGELAEVKSEKTVGNAGTIASGHEEPSSRSARNSSSTEQVEPYSHQGETIVIDETGKRRRRLVIAQPGALRPTPTIAAKSPTLDEPPSSPETLRKDTNANTSFESSIRPTSNGPVLSEAPILNPQELTVRVESATSTSDFALGFVDAAEQAGGVVMQKPKKRVRPIRVHEVDLDSEGQNSVKPSPKKADDTLGSSSLDLRDIRQANYTQQLSYGKKATRKAEQIYLGIEPMPIDIVIYGDVAFDESLDSDQATRTLSQSEQSNEPDNFSITTNSDVGKGQRLYVNARMKYLLRGQMVSLKRDGREHVGIIPYPDRISRKNCPLSITLFSPSSRTVTVSRANRSKWIKDKVVLDATEADARTGNVFNVADPAFACDEREDPEWKALEKWNFMEGNDDILPLHGRSDSEGEYDLETWREMEKERGEIKRPLGRSKTVKLTSVEVQSAIGVGIDQIVRDWTLKRLPKLKPKQWRLWAKSRRDRDSQHQIESFTLELERLEGRITGLRKEISQEEWSNARQINKQCKIIQPSIFDREDYKWRIATLKLQKAPEKLPPATRQPRRPKNRGPEEVLEDGEEILTAGTETSDGSEDDLNDFIVEDDVDGNTYQPVIVDDDLTMADVEDGIDSGTLIIDEPTPKTPTKRIDKLTQPRLSPSNVIDLTQQSDPVEPESFTPKPEPSYAIRTPPLYSSENDSDIFQRSRSKKPVFKLPPTFPSSPTKATEVVCLESDSDESKVCLDLHSLNQLPALNDVDEIRKMDAAELVERQDRKRLLMWTVAHTSEPQRRAAFDYMSKASMEQSRNDVISALTELRHHKRRLKNMDKEDSDSIMRIAAWRVCWTIPVKVSREGLQNPHVIATLEDDDGYEPFYDFLLQSWRHYQKIPSTPSQNKPKKGRKKIVREEFNEGLQDSQTRKRKYFVPESQETLDKRHAAQDRLRDNEERRRREELKPRITGMSKDSMDTLKVVVNPGKLADQDFVYLNPMFGNGARIKPHQEEGLQFLWREITAEHEDLQGCLLAQTMGLGKTMQVLALLVTLSEAARSSNKNLQNQVPPDLRKSRTLVLCPPALVENWWDECLLWLPQPLSNNVGELRKVTSAMKQVDRLTEIHAWSKAGGILLLGFDTFKSLIHNKPRKDGKMKGKKAPLDDKQHEMVKKALLQRPNLVVADEAHQFKSKTSSLNLAINQVQTKSRVALTGSPLNNNLGEYHSLVDWIAPGYLGSYPEFKATYEEPISEGLYQDSTDSQYRESRKRLKALELEMEPKVHRANVSCLHAELKGKSEFVIRVPLTKLQRDLYHIYVESVKTASSGKEPGSATLWSWLAVLRLLCNHPKCYKDKLLELETDSVNSKPAPQKRKARIRVAEETLIGLEDDAAILDEPVSRVALSKTENESRRVFELLVDPIDALFLSHKTQVLMNILKFSQDAHNKVLVFSHSIPTLDYIGEQLLKADKEYVRIDGKVDPQKRQSMTKVFNEGNTNICLVSTQAGGRGLNLFGANRVVIMDDHFNPMWELQAIGRAYRIGQQKPVYVYRLTVAGTFESAIQNQALFKEQLATRVVDKKNPNRSALKGAGQYLFPPKTVDQEDMVQFIGKDPLVLDRLLADPTTE